MRADIPGAAPACFLMTEHQGGGALLAGVHRAEDRLPLLQIAVGAYHSPEARALWAELAPRYAPLPPPWCAVWQFPTLTHHPTVSAWAGEFERGLAWAWIEHITNCH